MVIVVIVTIELGGFMGVFGIKMNPISAVTQISAVGIGEPFKNAPQLVSIDTDQYLH